MKNYYQILGLESGASNESIKKAYRLRAQKLHPDKHDNDAFFAEQFKELKEAYDVLSDEVKRRNYDLSFSRQYNSAKEGQSAKHRTQDLSKPTGAQQKPARVKRQTIYYRDKSVIVNGLEVICVDKTYKLSWYKAAEIKKMRRTISHFWGLASIVAGLLTLNMIYIGIILLYIGFAIIFYRSYALMLVNTLGKNQIFKGSKRRMRKIAKKINTAIKENAED